MSTSSGRCTIWPAWARWSALSRPGPAAPRGGGSLARDGVKQHGRQRRDPAAGGRLAGRRQGRGAGDRGHDLGLFAAAGRRQAAWSIRTARFLGSVSGGCVEGAVIEEALKSDRRRQAAAAGFRRQQRAGLGSRTGLRRQDPGLRRARRMKLAFLERALAASREGRSRGARSPTSRPAGKASSRTRRRRAIWRSTTPCARRVRRALGDDRNGTVETRARAGLHRGLQSAAALHHRRRGAYRAAPGAHGGARRAMSSPSSIRAAPSPPTSAFPTSSSRPNGRTRRWSA